jgi:hypothetical protein
MTTPDGTVSLAGVLSLVRDREEARTEVEILEARVRDLEQKLVECAHAGEGIRDRLVAENDECKRLLEAVGVDRWTGRPLVEMVREAAELIAALKGRA